jgi:hypothetical protein
MKKLFFSIGLCIFLFTSCTKHCPNLLDGPINDEEKKYFLSSAHTFLYSNQFGDSAYVYANAPVYSVLPITEDECDRIGNQAMNQLWRLPDGVQFDAYFQHDNGIETSRYLSLSLGTQQVFRYNIIDTSFITIVINTQRFPNTMVDSTDDGSLSPQIRKIWYGKHTGMLRYEKWNGEIWDRQKMIN